MKKLLGLMAIATVLSVVIMGCSQPAEGDPATPADPKTTAGTTGATPGGNSDELKPPTAGGETTGK